MPPPPPPPRPIPGDLPFPADPPAPADTATRARRKTTARWRGIGVWVAAGALIAGAGVITQLIPDDIHEDDAFAAPVSADGWAENRDIRVRIDEVATSDAVFQESFGSEWRAEANWVIVELRGEARTDALRGRIGDARLTIDGVTYRSTEGPGSDARSGAFTPGVASVTTLAFELPRGADPQRATLRIWPSRNYPSLDTEIVLDVDLTDAPHHDEVELQSAKMVIE